MESTQCLLKVDIYMGEVPLPRRPNISNVESVVHGDDEVNAK